MATTSATYAAHRAAGLCGFCPRPSRTSRCERCLTIQTASARLIARARARSAAVSDRRQTSAHADGWGGRGLQWAALQRTV